MQEENLDCEGIIDVGIIIMAHFVNPAQETAIEFLGKVISRKIKAVIPLTTFFGAFHIMTKHLKMPRSEILRSFEATLSAPSSAFYESIRKEDIRMGLSYAIDYSISSWDAYFLCLAKRLGTRTIFSIDEELKNKAEGFSIINPFSAEQTKKYHTFIASHLRRK